MGGPHLIQVEVTVKGEGECWIILSHSIRAGQIFTFEDEEGSWVKVKNGGKKEHKKSRVRYT